MLRRTCLAIITVAALAVPSLGQAESPVTGSYTVEGRNADGGPYAGSLVLRETEGRVTAEWRIGADSFRASGLREGRLITLYWADGADPVHYVVMPDGELHGTWADGRALERALPKR